MRDFWEAFFLVKLFTWGLNFICENCRANKKFWVSLALSKIVQKKVSNLHWRILKGEQFYLKKNKTLQTDW